MKRTGRQKDIVTPEKKQEQRELLRLFSANIRKILKNTDLLADDLQEIRLRTGAPLLVVAKDQEYFLTPDGALTGEWEKGYPVSPTDIRDTMDYIGSFSLYAYEDELRQGFLTVEGGHRIGIAGKTVIEGEKVKGISHISCINVRVAHEKKGCADRVMPYLWEDGRFLHTLIVSAPGCGKTTFGLKVAESAAKTGACLFFSLEMSTEQITARRIAAESGLSIGRLMVGGGLRDEEQAKLANAASVLSTHDFRLNRAPGASVSDIAQAAHLAKNLRLVVVDYLGLVRSDERGLSIYERVTKNSAALKSLARSLNVPILCLAQLNRAAEQRADKCPSMADLRDSGAIEQDADLSLIHI